MIGYIWLFFIASSIITAIFTGRIEAVTESILNSAKLAVEIAVSLIGIMAFWLGMMKIAEKSGIITFISKLIKPLARLLFPDVPSNHPSIGSMAMNFSANALGVTNAATPIGIKAMKELQSLNSEKRTATNAMCTFLAINTASFQLIPASVIAVLVASGSSNPSEIIAPTAAVTVFALIIAVIAAKVLERFSKQPDILSNPAEIFKENGEEHAC
jgi:spore maturation protein A